MPKIRNLLNNSISIIIISMFLGLFMYYSAYDVIMNYVENSLVEIAKQGALAVEKDIEKYLYNLEIMSSVDEIRDESIGLKDKIRILNDDFKLQNMLTIGIADSKGNSYTTDGKMLYIGDREYYKKASNGERTVSSPLINRTDGELVVIFAAPIYGKNGFNGVLYSSYPAEQLCRITDNIRLGEGGNSFIIDKNGTTIAHDNRALVYKGDNDFINVKTDPSLERLVAIEQKMVEGKTGAASYTYNGKEKYAGYAPIGSTGWSIAVTAPKSQVFGKISNVLLFLIYSIAIIIIAIVLINLYLNYLKRSLKRVQATSQSAIDSASIIILGIDENGKLEEFNKYAEIKTGYKAKEVIGKKKLIDMISIQHKEEAVKMLEGFISGEYPKNVELALYKNDGKLIYILFNYSMVYKKFMGKSIIEIMGIDITDRVLSEQELVENNEQLTILYDELHHLAYHDSLSHLPNRYMLEEVLQSLIESADGKKFALLYIDCDNFKFINDTMGHSFGDKVIVKMGKRIRSISGNDGYLFRLGGDEFYIILPDISNDREIEHFADSIIKSFKAPLNIDESSINMSISIGVALYPEHGSSIEELIKNSDIAMYKSKERGKGCYSIYSDSMNKAIIERLNVEKLLRKAIEKEEFVLYYQPQLCLKSDKICGFEALIRWQSPELGFVPPIKFIEIAEESGLIVLIGEWVLRKACMFASNIVDRGYAEFTMSVNLSVFQLIQHNFIDIIDDVLSTTKLDPKQLELEITESVLIESFEEVNRKLESLNNRGIKIALDDFGKGYSSLNYLRQLPISTLKIDKSFIDSIVFKQNEDILAGSLVDIGHKMGLCVVAEGVETEEQLEYLKAHSCDIIQGYLFSKPMPECEITKLLTTFLKNGQ